MPTTSRGSSHRAILHPNRTQKDCPDSTIAIGAVSLYEIGRLLLCALSSWSFGSGLCATA